MNTGKKLPTVRELMDTKREMIRKNEADFNLKLRQAPRAVQDEYHRCRAVIDRLLKARSKSLKRVDATLYPAKGKTATLTGIQVAWLLDLLSHPANGWQVSLSQPLSGGDDSDVTLLFHFDPFED